MSNEKLAAALQYHQQGRLREAELLYREMLEEQPQHPDATHLLGMVALQRGDAAGAIALIRRAIELSPEFADYHSNLSSGYLMQGDYEAAEAACRRAVQLRPQFAQAHNNLGNALLAQGRHAEAVDAYLQAAQSRPGYALPLANAAHAYRRLHKLQQARECCERALQIDPRCVEALNNLGDVCLQQGDFGLAADAFRNAAALRPESAEILNNVGIALQKLGRFEEAVPWHRQALQADPNSGRAYNGLGAALRELGDYEQSEAALRAALARRPDDPRVHNDLGELLHRSLRSEEAISSFQAAIALMPGLPEPHYNLANALRERGELDDAEAAYREALRLQPGFTAAMTNLAITLSEQGRTEEACEWFARAHAEVPDDPAVHSHWLVCRQYLPGITAAELREAHREWEQRHAAALPAQARTAPAQRRTLRVGFLSRDFRQHPVAFFLAGVLESAAQADLESICFSDSRQQDSWTVRLRAAAAEWHDVADRSDAALADELAQHDLDVLFDLAGHTAGHRLLTFARRPVPVQLTWMGYVGTTGCSAVDYLVTDRFHSPPGSEGDYVERVLRLPDGYVCYTPPTDVELVFPSRDRPLTFGCFNNPAKISQPTLEMWGEILNRVPGSQLLLKYYGWQSARAQAHFRGRCEALGLDPQRLVMEGPAPHAMLLSRYGDVDVALDTAPYSGGLTTCEALWMGLPVVTLPGATFASRHAHSHLSSVGLAEGVTHSAEEYIERAVQWAADAEWRHACRSTLRDRMRASPLCDAARFTTNLATALRTAISSHG